MPFTRTMDCLCVESWQALPLCLHESEVDQRYAYGVWIHPNCTQHRANLAGMQEMIKEMRDDVQA